MNAFTGVRNLSRETLSTVGRFVLASVVVLSFVGVVFAVSQPADANVLPPPSTNLTICQRNPSICQARVSIPPKVSIPPLSVPPLSIPPLSVPPKVSIPPVSVPTPGTPSTPDTPSTPGTSQTVPSHDAPVVHHAPFTG